MNLSGQLRKQLEEALIDAFPKNASLERMLSYELEKNLRAITDEGSLQDTVFELIQTAYSEEWVEDLVKAACRSNPRNARLKTIAELLLNHAPETHNVISIPQEQSHQPPKIAPSSTWLDGRTDDGIVRLAQSTKGESIGTKWRVHNVDDEIITLECLSYIPGPKWLDGRTSDGTVGLALSTEERFTGTRWRVHEVGNGIMTLECLGHIQGPKWLDGRTSDGTVGLAPSTEDGFTGTRWRFHNVDNEIITLECLSDVPTSSQTLLESNVQPQKILILAAIPHGLRLDKEIREIEEAIRRATNRDLFEIKIRTALRPQDIRRALAEEEPSIVHFCGHGEEDGSLLLEDDGGNNKPVTPSSLASLFKLHALSVKCVLLNVCYSEKSAVAISQYINYVIGMNNPVQDNAAIEFAKGFYDGLGYKNIGNQDMFQRAFDEGMVAMEMESLSQESIPVLKKHFSQPNQDEYYSQLSPEEMFKRLTKNAKLRWSKSSGDLRYIDDYIVDATNSIDIKLHNFILEAKFYNPYNGTDSKWKYGFSFRETSSDLNNPQRQVYTMWISSDDQILSLEGYENRLEEKISNLDVLENSFNQVHLLVFRETAIVYINNIYTQKFEIFDGMTPGKVYLVSAGNGNRSAKYESLKVSSISN